MDDPAAMGAIGAQVIVPPPLGPLPVRVAFAAREPLSTMTPTGTTSFTTVLKAVLVLAALELVAVTV